MAVALIAIFKRDDGLPLVYKLATALFFAGGAVLIFDGGLRAMASGVFFAGYGSLIVVLSAVCAKAFFSFRIGISRCIAACFGALYLGETAGSAISALTAAAGAAPPPTAAGLIVVCAIAGVYVFLFTEMDFVRLGLGEVEAVVPGEGNEDDGKAALAEDREDAIARVSSLVAERYGLSPRESEVLPLLLQGRTIARIQETLYISQGTVSTHIRHIYQKAGVDNRQDLLNLVEQIAHEHVVNRRSDAS